MIFILFAARLKVRSWINGLHHLIRMKSRRHFDFYIKSDEGDDVVTAIRLRDIVRRFHMYLHSGERVGQGQRCGYFYFGGVIDVFIPLESKVQVEVGQYVQSGSTVLAQIIHSEVASVIQNDIFLKMFKCTYPFL